MMAIRFELKEKTKDEIEREKIDGRLHQMETGEWPEEVCKDYVKFGKSKTDLNKMKDSDLMYFLREGFRYIGVCIYSSRKNPSEYSDDAALNDDIDEAEKEMKKLIAKYKEYHPDYEMSEEDKAKLEEFANVLNLSGSFKEVIRATGPKVSR